MNKQSVILILILGIAFLGLAAAKDYNRSCDCQYSGGVGTANCDTVDGPSYTYPLFSGKGTIEDFEKPN